MNKKEFLNSGLIEKYILGLTTEDQDRIVESFMETDKSIKRQILESQDALFVKAKSYAKKVPDDAKSAIFQQISDEEVTNTSRNRAIPMRIWIQYAAIGLLLLSTGILYVSNQDLLDQNRMLTSNLDECSTSMASIDGEKATLVSNEYILTHSATKRIDLRGTNLSPQASLLAFYNPKAEVLMIKINKLPPPPQGKYYHMWADVEGVMKHVGSISAEDLSLKSLDFVASAESLNVTLEDDQEVEHPNVSQLTLRGNI